MDNRIRTLRVWDRRLDPGEVEVAIVAKPEQLTSTTQIRGRLMGPRCRYTSTVEVAYPLREVSRRYEKEGTPRIISRVIIPEASFWDPESPFLYEGPVELWQQGQLCDQVQLRRGLRLLNLGPRGLRCNGHLLTLRGAVRNEAREDDLLHLHQAGCNALLAPVEVGDLWDLADRLGFFMLGRMVNRSSYGREYGLEQHSSCLGWVLEGGILQHPIVKAAGVLPIHPLDGQLVGIELSQRPPGPLPAALQFVVCSEELLPALADINLPKLLLKATGFLEAQGGQGPAAEAGILGWVYA